MNKFFSRWKRFSYFYAALFFSSIIFSSAVLASQPDVQILDVRLDPTAVPVDRPFDFKVEFKISDSAMEAEELSAVLHFDILKGDKTLFTSQSSSLSCTSGQPATWLVHMNPVSSKGLYTITAYVNYGKLSARKNIELAIGIPPSRPVNYRSAAPADVTSATPVRNSSPAKNAGVIHVRHILFRSKSEALDVIAELNGLGGAKLKQAFIASAKVHSIGPSASAGGDIGYIKRGQMVAPFERAAFGLGIGTMTGAPVKTGYGYHLIYREE